jgi:hypothetical protein
VGEDLERLVGRAEGRERQRREHQGIEHVQQQAVGGPRQGDRPDAPEPRWLWSRWRRWYGRQAGQVAAVSAVSYRAARCRSGRPAWVGGNRRSW